MSDLLHPLSFSLLLIFLLFLFFISMAVQSNSSYLDCSSYDCNGILISYPFWRIDNRNTSHVCGYKGFGINCSTIDGSERPIIDLEGHWYYVKNISYVNTSIVLVDYNVSEDCPRVRRQFNFEYLPFNFIEHNVNLSFHFNCTGNPRIAYPIPCLNYTSKKSWVNIYGSESEKFNWSEYLCEEEVVTAVLDAPLNLGEGEELWKALNAGFELKWREFESETCGVCEDSDNRCGFIYTRKDFTYGKTEFIPDTTEFMCFCKDGSITSHKCKGSRIKWKAKVTIAIVSTLFGIFLMVIIFCCWLKRPSNKKRYYGSSYMSRNISSYTSSTSDPEKNGTYHGVQIFKYRELEKATNHFDDNNELGDGGFGTVYQGKLKDGRVVAVKRLYENNYKRVEQFMNEVGILAHLRHQNLVSLYGCTTHHSRELLLVYEYIPNGTVADHLHGEKSNPTSLTWPTRLNIAIETASALVYLHASDIVHRDVKTNNILLDNNFTVKVADFGLSRLFPNNVTHVSTAPQGTPGYVDPEYHECYQLTSKSDVYSFGVVLIELISSKPAVDITRHRHEINLSNMAMNKIRNDLLHELVDPNLGFESDYGVTKMISAVAELAFQCLQNERDCRPSMDEVLEGLIRVQNGGGDDDGRYNKEKQEVVMESTRDDAVLLKNVSTHAMSPDSVVIAWSTSTTTSTGSG